MSGISEKQLGKIERTFRGTPRPTNDEVVLELCVQVRRLRAERDWLTEKVQGLRAENAELKGLTDPIAGKGSCAKCGQPIHQDTICESCFHEALGA